MFPFEPSFQRLGVEPTGPHGDEYTMLRVTKYLQLALTEALTSAERAPN